MLGEQTILRGIKVRLWYNGRSLNDEENHRCGGASARLLLLRHLDFDFNALGIQAHSQGIMHSHPNMSYSIVDIFKRIYGQSIYH